MDRVLNTPQREQAGSESYNRFEYQVHWIVFHIVNQLEENPKCIIFCEYHDDMAQLKDGIDGEFEFYQIKTKKDPGEWSLAELSTREKKSNGFYKKSFLGWVYYNFLVFGKECSCCHFTSNAPFDNDIRKWQAYIEDEKEIKDIDLELYERIKKRIRDEYLEELPDDFDIVFDRFIQNTFIYDSELQLTTYEKQVSGHFFDWLGTKRIPSNTAHTIFQQLLNEVRKKSKNTVEPPISYRSLINKKGIVIEDINKKLDEKMGDIGEYADFYTYLQRQGVEEKRINELVKTKQSHDMRWLNVEDLIYQETILLIRKEIEEVLSTQCNNEIDMEELKKSCCKSLKENGITPVAMDKNLIEVVYYERKCRTS